MAKAATRVKVSDSTTKGKDFLPSAAATYPSAQKPTKAPNSGKSFKAPGPNTAVTNVPTTGPKTGKK